MNTAELNTLRTFAVGWADTYDGLTQFAHLVTAALNGEAFAIKTLGESFDARLALSMLAAVQNNDSLLSDTDIEEIARLLASIDTTRPDGAIARKLEWI